MQRTIQDCDGDRLLEFAPGEEHLTLSEDGDMSFGPSASGGDRSGCERDEEGDTPRLSRRASILNFLQLSDFQMVDEESPARVEFLDFTQRPPGFRPFSAAYRPQETLTTQVTEAMVRQARNTTSPVTGARLDFSILTGDNADNQQFNEIRWFIDILDGTAGPGNPDPSMDTSKGKDRKVEPDSGLEGEISPACSAGLPYEDNGSDYDGVRDDGVYPGHDAGYYEPNSSRNPNNDGDGYSPNPNRNQSEVGERVKVRDFPGLFEEAQEPFEAVGLGMPWYSAFGNHDALVQGNSGQAYEGPFGSPTTEVFNPVYNTIATGCLKPTRLPPGVPQTQEGLEAFYRDFSQDPQAYMRDCLAKEDEEEHKRCDTSPVVVPPDPRRCFVAKAEEKVAAPETPCQTGGFVEQHFRTTGEPKGHGFAPSPEEPQGEDCDGADRTEEDCLAASYGRPPEAVAAHDGYYSFSPREGLRFVVLDSVTDECIAEPFCSEGTIDDPQFRWLERQIETAKAAGQYVLVFSHHTLQTTRQESSDPSEHPLHFGEEPDDDAQPEPPSEGETLESLYCRSANVLAHVDGHEHENSIRPQCEQSDETGPTASRFVEISTAAHIDFPQQSRMIELVEEEGQVSLVLTILDHDGPANPGGPKPCRDGEAGCEDDTGGRAPDQVIRLASIGREIGFNDYQADPEGARGTRDDRNVIVKTGRPWPHGDR